MPTTSLDDRTIAYLDEGSGETPIVMLHGFPLDSTMWEPQVQHLAAEYRIVAPDLAGFGGSDPLAEREPYWVESWADDVIALCGLLGLDHVTLVGWSLGADVALAVARRERDLVGALAVAGLRPEPPSPDEQRSWAQQEEWVAGGGDVDAIVDRLVDELVGKESTRRSEVAKLVRVMAGRMPPAGWTGGFHALGTRPAPGPDADKLDIPVVVVCGEGDALVKPDDLRDWAASIPGGGFIPVPDAGHLPNLENPAAFNRVLDDLLAGRLSRRPPGKHPWPAAPAATR